MTARPNGGRVIETQDKRIVFENLDGNTALEEVSGVSQLVLSRWLADFCPGIAGNAAECILREYDWSPLYARLRQSRLLYTLQELAIDVSSLKKRAGGQMTQPEPFSTE